MTDSEKQPLWRRAWGFVREIMTTPPPDTIAALDRAIAAANEAYADACLSGTSFRKVLDGVFVDAVVPGIAAVAPAYFGTSTMELYLRDQRRKNKRMHAELERIGMEDLSPLMGNQPVNERAPEPDYTDQAKHVDAQRDAQERIQRDRNWPAAARTDVPFRRRADDDRTDAGIPWSFGIDGNGSVVPFPVRAVRLASGTIIIRIGCTAATLEQWNHALEGGRVGESGYTVPPERRAQLEALLVLIEAAYARLKPHAVTEAAAVACTGTDELPDFRADYRNARRAADDAMRASIEDAPPSREPSRVSHRIWLSELERRIDTIERRLRL